MKISDPLEFLPGLAITLMTFAAALSIVTPPRARGRALRFRSEEHTSELQSPCNLVCRLLLEKKNLDCRLGLDGIQTNRQRAEKIRALLPVQFSADELNYIALKSVAKWSSPSNAIKHPPGLKACREAEARTTGAGLSLLEIQAEAHLAKWEITQAEKVLDEYLRT